MEHQLWKAIVAVLRTIGKRKKSTAFDFSDEDIVEVFYWAVVNDRPILWACSIRNWPIHLRKKRRPSPSTMSRRLRSVSVCALLDALEQHVVRPQRPGLFWIIDGKPLVISGCSKDRQAGYGRAAGGKAKGDKRHALTTFMGEIAAWRVAPMNKDERVMARRLLKSAAVVGYVVGDTNYDSNPLHSVCDERGNLQLITRRRYGPGRGTGHKKQTAGRPRSIERVENPCPKFADQMLHDRAGIERAFGNHTNWGGGLTGLPPWVRTHRRVHRWVQAKLVLTALKRTTPLTTYVT